MSPDGGAAGVSSTDRLLGAGPVAKAAAALSAGRLRILAYHGVPDLRAFRAQLEYIARDYRPVTGAQVADAVNGGAALPRRAVWVTFDDGRSDVVTAGLPELDRAGVPASMFVCPGLVIDAQPFWWDVVTTALTRRGSYDYEGATFTDRALVTALKKVPDEERRHVLADLSSDEADLSSDEVADPTTAGVLSVAELQQWVAAGHEIGNHTWDHPCLDQCPPEVQRDQVERAHTALTDLLGEPPTLFAYPNGDWADAAEAALVACGYRVGLLFDHRLASVSQQRLRLSRLRIDSDAPMARATAIISGGHSTVFQARAALAARRSGGKGSNA